MQMHDFFGGKSERDYFINHERRISSLNNHIMMERGFVSKGD